MQATPLARQMVFKLYHTLTDYTHLKLLNLSQRKNMEQPLGYDTMSRCVCADQLALPQNRPGMCVLTPRHIRIIVKNHGNELS